jgi:ADP-ribose pyrophosphatase YjhB (NUDIX family)
VAPHYGRRVSIFAVRQRVACYVTRPSDAGPQLLVFEHVADDPSHPSGVQVPGGGKTAFEAVETAALREVEEESGLTGLTFQAQLGAVERGVGDPVGPSITTYVHVTSPAGGPPAWEHTVSGEGEDAGMTFACRWEPLPLGFDLAAGQAAYLDRLPT